MFIFHLTSLLYPCHVTGKIVSDLKPCYRPQAHEKIAYGWLTIPISLCSCNNIKTAFEKEETVLARYSSNKNAFELLTIRWYIHSFKYTAFVHFTSDTAFCAISEVFKVAAGKFHLQA